MTADWYVHRRADGGIASAHQEPQPDYAEEKLSDADAELLAFLAPTKAPDPADLDNAPDRDKALLLAVATLTGKTPDEARDALKKAWGAVADTVKPAPAIVPNQ